MSQMQRRVIQVISKPSAERGTQEIDMILPWLRKKSQLMQTLEKSVIVDIVRYCDYQRMTRDDVIIRQGEIGECFYIILNGIVSVYIDGSKTGEEEKAKTPAVKKEEPAVKKEEEEPAVKKEEGPDSNDQEAQEGTEEEQGEVKVETVVEKKLDRSDYGKCVIRFESGRSFGEIALMTEDAVRNASIIADEDVDLMVIHRDLYNQTLKAYQEKEYEERRKFVSTHPLFKQWNSRFRRLLEMSITREVYSYDSPIYRQGEAVNGLAFITAGRAKVIVEPGRHSQQYPQLKPFPTKNDVYELESLRPRRKVGQLSKSVDTANHSWFKTKRQEGYAAVEKLRQQRSVVLCQVEEGEILGDVEAVMGLETYMQSVVCTSSRTELFVLNSKNFERLITRKNSSTLDLLRMIVETKVTGRAPTVQGMLVPLVQHVKFKLTQEIHPRAKKPPEMRTRKELPDDDILFQQMVDAYAKDEASLIKPYIPGSVYYKTLMRKKADIRESIRNHQTKARQNLKRVRRKIRINTLPRTLVHLKNDLHRQMETGKMVEFRLLLSDLRQTEQSEIEEEYRRQYGSRSHSNRLSPIKSTKPSEEIVSTGRSSKSHRRPPNYNVYRNQEHGFLTSGKATYLNTSGYDNGHSFAIDASYQQESVSTEESDSVENGENNYGRNPLPPIRVPTMDSISNPEFTQERHSEGERELHSAAATLDNGANLDIASDTEGDVDRNRQGSNVLGDGLYLSASDYQPVISPTRKNLFNNYVRDRLLVSYESPDYRDWETSHSTLSDLEWRIARFNEQYGKGFHSKAYLPKLTRFEKGDDIDEQPKPGGKVLVKPRACALKGVQGTSRNHQHERYHIVPEIPKWNELRMHKRVKQLHQERIRPMAK